MPIPSAVDTTDTIKTFRTKVNDLIAVVTTWNAGTLPAHNQSASTITSGVFTTARLPAATSAAAGIVMLSDSTTSTSTTKAATPAAVKALNDQLASQITAATLTKATLAEAQVGTEDTHYVTPAKVQDAFNARVIYSTAAYTNQLDSAPVGSIYIQHAS